MWNSLCFVTRRHSTVEIVGPKTINHRSMIINTARSRIQWYGQYRPGIDSDDLANGSWFYSQNSSCCKKDRTTVNLNDSLVLKLNPVLFCHCLNILEIEPSRLFLLPYCKKAAPASFSLISWLHDYFFSLWFSTFLVLGVCKPQFFLLDLLFPDEFSQKAVWLLNVRRKKCF